MHTDGMRIFALVVFAVSLLTGCPGPSAPACPPDGTGFADATGLYCAYGVVIGGFRNCPSGLPNRFDFDDGSFVCSDHPIGSRDMIPRAACEALPACRMSSAMDAGPPSVDAGPPVDAALPSGPFACGDGTCSEGQICLWIDRVTQATYMDANVHFDAGSPWMCVTRPPECGGQGDCSRSSCDPACTSAVCRLVAGYQTADLTVSGDGTRYYCPVSTDAS